MYATPKSITESGQHWTTVVHVYHFQRQTIVHKCISRAL